MKKFFKYFFYFLVVALVIIQFFRPAKNVMEKNLALQKDISVLYKIPDDVNNVMQKACYDCHTNNTAYPWYNNIQPVAWYLNNHIVDGKRHFNYNDFLNYSLRKQYHKLEEVKEQVEHNEMPLSSYTITHNEAKLSAAEKLLIMNWADSVRAAMERQYPIDSLIRKKK